LDAANLISQSQSSRGSNEKFSEFSFTRRRIPLKRGNCEGSYESYQVADLLFGKRSTPGGHETGLANGSATFGDDFQKKFIVKLVHDRAVGMVGRFGRQGLSRHPIALTFVTM